MPRRRAFLGRGWLERGREFRQKLLPPYSAAPDRGALAGLQGELVEVRRAGPRKRGATARVGGDGSSGYSHRIEIGCKPRQAVSLVGHEASQRAAFLA